MPKQPLSNSALPAVFRSEIELTTHTHGQLPILATDQFGSGLPKNCPPSAATVGPKLLFRLVSNNPPSPSDFRTTHEEGKYLSSDPCQRCSISMLSSAASAQKMRKIIPNLKDRRIAAGTIPADAGAIMSTPSKNNPDHWSWWPKMHVVRHSYFEVIDEAA